MIPFVRVTPQALMADDMEWELFDAQDFGVPEDAVGIWVLATNSSTTYGKSYKIRCNGSTDDRGGGLSAPACATAYIAVDANGQFEAMASGSLTILGYILPNAVMFTNGVDASVGTTGLYVATDCSSFCPGAKALIAETYYPGGSYNQYGYTIRMNGSTDDFTSEDMAKGHKGRIIGVDAGCVFEQKASNINLDLFIHGYCPGYVTMHTNAIDRSKTGTWVDVQLTAGAGVGFLNVDHRVSSYYDGLRKNGTSDAVSCNNEWSTYTWAVECDENSIIETRNNNSANKLREIGYAYNSELPSAPTTLWCEGEETPSAVTDVTPELSAVLNDPDSGDTLTRIAIQVGSSEGVADLWDSGWLDIEAVSEGERCEDVSYAGVEIPQAGQTLYWRIRAMDQDLGEGAWSAWTTFTMAPKEVAVTDSGVGAEQNMTIGDEFIVVPETGSADDSVAQLSRNQTVAIIVTVPARQADTGYPEKDDTIIYNPNNE